jgi:hypothetical protein
VQDATVPLPDRVHCVALKTPGPLLVKLTVPEGAVALPGEVSLTVDVHLLRTGLTCWQASTVLVTRSVTAMAAWPLLAVWMPSPP